MNPRITFIDIDGNTSQISADIGDSLMEAAVKNGVDGIVADCGGACACATCHVYIDKSWQNKVNSFGETEEDMLEMVEDFTENSRLSCQIQVTESLDGLVVNLPESQI